ncbi:phosphatidate cytidylyltransferase [Helcococcus ovis]|uniref:Phosphatidate cytidylyltransferase n=4 Tax=Helcococcus ovis TaxID=72026 RepID=A0A4R9C173_9FIRM|nr:phosphatidate cytidylyltransferase [Helcococcus ovis]TFF65455.1 phosphatidate cytidylyltransferase [Helcococcus ovis]TFF66091.1 phosphatidate cytidylyltransferase [Helcococcus ovis]TFF67855.1 phosphatidate cytidylyltransferase [Helcococcus ovis]WNZ02034.1 phosphatidate cytidylyltransferase [Helcococcus ovis]
MKSNLLKRVITGIILIFIILAMIYFNNPILTCGLLILSNIAIFELSKALKKINYVIEDKLLYILNSILILSTLFYDIKITFSLYILMIVIIFSFIILKKECKINDILGNIFIILYITAPYILLLNLRDSKWILYAYALPSFTDTFAYAIGILFGKHKLIERLSPKKTVEGAFGGILGGIVFTYIFINIFNLNQDLFLYGFAIIFSIFSQIGDLFASLIKRKAGIKDYGSILIGHGGIMDRFDSLLFVAPLVYVMIINLRL